MRLKRSNSGLLGSRLRTDPRPKLHEIWNRWEPEKHKYRSGFDGSGLGFYMG
ncbi:hypothetical protein HanIR_Chr09g0449331 [Helianthus annuus]|nr:hypothetical protein HanIR_Chr09g0449331 [Helianthus annuus]